MDMTCLCNTLVLSSQSGNFYVYMQHNMTNYVYLFLHTHTHVHHSLNPEKDPLCALLLIEYCAVRAGEYKFIIDLFHAWEVSLTHAHTHTHTHTFHSCHLLVYFVLSLNVASQEPLTAAKLCLLCPSGHVPQPEEGGRGGGIRERRYRDQP